MSQITSFLIGFLSIALMVTVHETGHFLVARMVGITVETFAIGWGKALKKWRKNGVEYRINIFPLGGYCKLKGSEDLRKALDVGDTSFTGMEKGSLFAVPPHRRILAYLAGPLFNLIFAMLLFIPFFALDHEVATLPNRIVLTSDYPQVFSIDADSPHAARDGQLRMGDVVIAIDGTEITEFADIQSSIATLKADRTARFTVMRDGAQLSFDITGIVDEETGRLFFGLSYFLKPVIGFVDPVSPEAISGLQIGDRIVQAQGTAVQNTMDLIEILVDNPPEITLDVLRDEGEYITVRYSPNRTPDGNITFGFSFARNVIWRDGMSWGRSVMESAKETAKGLWDTITLIPRMFSGAFEFDEMVAGPLRISYVIGEMRNAGLRALLHLLAMVSVSLATANLLPIPGLDGGFVLLSVIEMIRGKSVSPRMYVRFQSVGVTLLLVLMLFVIAGDLRFLFSGP